MKMIKPERQDGFTIIELLIATTVFTLVLILLTTGTLAVTRLYYKGLISAQTQTATRNVVNDVTQALQFSGATYTPLSGFPQWSGNEQGFCIGGVQFSDVINQEVTDSSPVAHALLERNVGNNCSSPAPTGPGLDSMSNPSTSPSSTELLSAHMQLNNLDVTQPDPTNNPTLFCVSVRIIYGDNDLLTPAKTATDSCGNTYQQQQCNGTFGDLIGGQFCAVSGLDTYVQERVAPT